MEDQVQEELWKELGGSREVYANGRRFDLVTKDQVIEVKRNCDKLDALKIMYYALHYPDLKPRIHLFDQNNANFPRDPLFAQLCDKYNIKLTYREATK